MQKDKKLSRTLKKQGKMRSFQVNLSWSVRKLYADEVKVLKGFDEFVANFQMNGLA